MPVVTRSVDIALHLLRVCADRKSSVEDVHALACVDKRLEVSLIRQARSAHYGDREVEDLRTSIEVVGLEMVRAHAAVRFLEAGLPSGAKLPVPLWRHCLETSVAASIVAERIGIDPNEAAATGLVHDLGVVVLAKRRPSEYRRALGDAALDPPSLVQMEQELLAEDHATVGAHTLRALGFPTEIVIAVALHHSGPDAQRTALGRALVAAEALVQIRAVAGFDEAVEDASLVLTRTGIGARHIPDLLDDVTQRLGEQLRHVQPRRRVGA